jgi:hypothetical protein
MNTMIAMFAIEGSGASNQTVTQVEPDGRYEFQPMPPGDYQLMLFGSTTVSLTVPELTDFRFDIDLPHGVIRGRVIREDGQPVGQVTVQAVRQDAGSLLSRLAQAMGDAEGGFALRRLAPGTYDVMATAVGYGSGHLDGVELAEGQVITGIEIRVSSGGQARIRVIDAGGALVPKATAMLLRPNGLPVGFESRQAGTDPGVSLFGTVPAGTYRVLAGEETLGCAWQDGVRITKGEETQVTVVLTGAGSPIAATVTAGGAPVAGATIEILDQQGRILPDLGRGLGAMFSGATTDAEGAYTTGTYPPGTYTVRVTPSDPTMGRGEPATGTVQVPPGTVEIAF